MKKLLAFVWLFAFVVPVMAHSVVVEDDCYKIKHNWTYNEVEWSCKLSIPIGLYDYCQKRTHVGDDFSHYVLSEFDRDCIRDLVHSFRIGGEKYGLSETDNVYNVICFVQSLQYMYDIKSKKEEEYVRYPVETLVDGVGDCEDMVILAASILYEMGYKVLLVNLPDHLALAVESKESFPGTYYEYEGSRYYYLEMTNVGWDLGQIPVQFKNVKATLIPIVNKPVVLPKSCSYQYDSYWLSDATVEFKMHCAIDNLGPGKTDAMTLHVLFKPYASSTHVHKEQQFRLVDLSEGGSAEFEVKVPVPRPFMGVIEFRVEGLNFDTKSIFVDGVTLE